MDEQVTIVILGGSGDLTRRKLVPAPPRLTYCAGSWGPAEADMLLAGAEHHWLRGYAASDHD